MTGHVLNVESEKIIFLKLIHNFLIFEIIARTIVPFIVFYSLGNDLIFKKADEKVLSEYI